MSFLQFNDSLLGIPLSLLSTYVYSEFFGREQKLFWSSVVTDGRIFMCLQHNEGRIKTKLTPVCDTQLYLNLSRT